MPSWTNNDFLAYQLKQLPKAPKASVGVDKEIPLHNKIMAHCDLQFPRWKYIRSRSDQASTIGCGVCDFTIFLPGKVLCIECKTKDGKLSEAQRGWAKEMEMIGHTVYIIRSFEEFLALI